MTEAEARAWIETRFGATRLPILERIVEAVTHETKVQNLIAQSTVGTMWSRHIVDSAQLLLLSDPARSGRWTDIGSGAGFPGIVIAALCDREVTLVEVRRKRADFLKALVEGLDFSSRVTVVAKRIEAVTVKAEIISARAVASLSDLLDLAGSCATPTTQWILPKGKSAREEVERALQAWHGVFHVEQSITDPDSLIVIATDVSRRGTSS